LFYSKFPLIAYYGLLVYISAFFPGIAALHFARKARWAIVPTAIAVLLILAPIVVVLVFPIRLPFLGGDQSRQFIFALWFFPGLLVLLNKHRLDNPHLGAIACITYLFPFLLVALIANYRSGQLVYVTVTIAAATVIIAAFRTKRLLLSARVLGVVLLLLPLVMSLGLRLPVYAAMAHACSEKAGMEVRGASRPVSAIAMHVKWFNPAEVTPMIGCKSDCATLLFDEDVAIVEVLLPDQQRNSSGDSSRWIRYRLSSPLETDSIQRGESVEDGICAMRLESKGRCIVATPIEGYTADYLVRPQVGETPVEGIEMEAYEIVARETGEVVAWTRSFAMPIDPTVAFYDVPLNIFVERRGRCNSNGAGFGGLIRTFLDES